MHNMPSIIPITEPLQKLTNDDKSFNFKATMVITVRWQMLAENLLFKNEHLKKFYFTNFIFLQS